MIVACSWPPMHKLVFVTVNKHKQFTSLTNYHKFDADTPQHKSTLIMPNKNGPFKDYLTLNFGTYLRICHLNIEGISKAKSEIVSKIIIINKVGVITLQEIHTTADLKK